MPGPRATMGGQVQRYSFITKAARILLDGGTENPELMRDLQPIVDKLTKLLEKSVAPTKRPGNGPPPAGPTLDETPTGPGPDQGSSMAALLQRQQSGLGGMNG
jgi:hypothetical protein